MCKDAWYAVQRNIFEHEELQSHPADASEGRERHVLHVTRVVLHRIEVEEIQDKLDKDAPETNAEHLLDDVADAV